MGIYAVNLKRLMARKGITLAGVVEASGLHERTIKSILNGSTNPHPRTLHRLAAGLGASPDEFFRPAPAEFHAINGSDPEFGLKVSALLKTDTAVLLRSIVDVLYANRIADSGELACSGVTDATPVDSTPPAASCAGGPG